MKTIGRLGAALVVLGLLALVPVPASADHCGSDATITPATGLAGTTFEFEANLGGPAIVSVYRNDALVDEAELETIGPIRFEIVTSAADAGEWRVHAEAQSQPECQANAAFEVLAAPDTSTERAATSLPSVALAAGLLLLAAVAFVLAMAPARRT